MHLMRALLALSVLLGCAERVNRVRLVIPEEAVGLSCVDSATGDRLLDRAPNIDDGVEASLVLDYLDLRGVPSCRVAQILDWCERRGCPLVRRNCIRVRLAPVPGADMLASAFGQEVARMSPITHNAPDGIVLVRAVLTAQVCEELERDGVGEFPRMRCEALLGCTYSCPIQLDEVRGDVELELDVIGGECTEYEIGICAGLGVGDGTCE